MLEPNSALLDFSSQTEIYIDEFLGTSIVHQERELFLHAATQLLDVHSPASTLNVKLNSNSSWRSLRPDIIRLGRLGKCSRRGAQLVPQWKPKFVEVKFGAFIYEDDSISGIVNAKKSIPLKSDVCKCRSVKLKCVNGDCIFELSVRGGADRLFQASSPADKESWILAIRAAMLIAPGKDLLHSSGILGSEAVNSNSSPPRSSFGFGNANINSLSARKRLIPSPFTSPRAAASPRSQPRMELQPKNAADRIGNGHKQSSGATLSVPSGLISSPILKVQPEMLSPTLMLCCSHSLPGPAAVHADEVARFCAVRSLFLSAQSASQFRDVITRLNNDQAEVIVPVYFVKNQFYQRSQTSFSMAEADSLPHASSPASNVTTRALSIQLDRSKHPADADTKETQGQPGVGGGVGGGVGDLSLSFSPGSGSASHSQVWKDMSRDKVCINGCLLSGQEEGGVLEIVSTLMRCITSHADSIREDKSSIINSHLLGSKCEGNAVSSSLGSNVDDPLEKESAAAGGGVFDLSETDTLACVKDLLVLCNRTQSGGDTYFCVDALLARCGLDSFVVEPSPATRSSGRAGSSCPLEGERMCVLTPSQCQSDPLDIHIRVVKPSEAADLALGTRDGAQADFVADWGTYSWRSLSVSSRDGCTSVESAVSGDAQHHQVQAAKCDSLQTAKSDVGARIPLPLSVPTLDFSMLPLRNINVGTGVVVQAAALSASTRSGRVDEDETQLACINTMISSSSDFTSDISLSSSDEDKIARKKQHRQLLARRKSAGAGTLRLDRESIESVKVAAADELIPSPRGGGKMGMRPSSVTKTFHLDTAETAMGEQSTARENAQNRSEPQRSISPRSTSPRSTVARKVKSMDARGSDSRRRSTLVFGSEASAASRRRTFSKNSIDSKDAQRSPRVDYSIREKSNNNSNNSSSSSNIRHSSPYGRGAFPPPVLQRVSKKDGRVHYSLYLDLEGDDESECQEGGQQMQMLQGLAAPSTPPCISAISMSACDPSAEVSCHKLSTCSSEELVISQPVGNDTLLQRPLTSFASSSSFCIDEGEVKSEIFSGGDANTELNSYQEEKSDACLVQAVVPTMLFPETSGDAEFSTDVISFNNSNTDPAVEQLPKSSFTKKAARLRSKGLLELIRTTLPATFTPRRVDKSARRSSEIIVGADNSQSVKVVPHNFPTASLTAGSQQSAQSVGDDTLIGPASPLVSPTAAPVKPFLQITVRAVSRYRVCCADPQGTDEDNWATIQGDFSQVFSLHSNSGGRLSATDKMVRIRLFPPDLTS